MLQGLEDLRSALEVQKLNPLRLLLTLQPPGGMGEPDPNPKRAKRVPSAATKSCLVSTETESERSKGEEKRRCQEDTHGHTPAHPHPHTHKHQHTQHEQKHEIKKQAGHSWGHNENQPSHDHHEHRAKEAHGRSQQQPNDSNEATPNIMNANSQKNASATPIEVDHTVQVSRSTTRVGPVMFTGTRRSPPAADPDAAAAAAALLAAHADSGNRNFNETSGNGEQMPATETLAHGLSEEDEGAADDNSSLAGHKVSILTSAW